MPLSTVCVSIVSNRPRLWSSQTNIRIKAPQHVPPLYTMNSAEEIATYQSPQEFYGSPTFLKRATLGHSVPEKAKKEKKWSIGSLFRRKKKEETESSSEEEQRRGFLGRRRRKSDGKRRKAKTTGFDHIVLPKTQYNGYNHREDTGILSDPSGGFSNYTGRVSGPAKPETLYVNLSQVHASSLGSGDSIFQKKRGKELVKARAAARRTTLGNESSSEEDSSLRSSSSLRMRSDESLAREGGLSKRSRAARTERYLKRHSRDGENPHNYLRLSKSDDQRSPSRSPKIGLSTVPPSHGLHGRYKVSNSTSNPSYKPPLSMNEYNKGLEARSEEQVLHVNFPILRPSPQGRQPPQPPPRDPSRITRSHLEGGRPTTVNFDSQCRAGLLAPPRSSLNADCRSASELHIPSDRFQIGQVVRPASTTPEPRRVEGFNYLTDKHPRSRRPIVIQTGTVERKDSPTQKALDFWKQIEESVNKACPSPHAQIFTSQTHVQSQVFLPRATSPFQPIEASPKRKSANLEEALDELEAIYNSLRLGDENLLERAEQRENETLAEARKSKTVHALSDSSFSYEPFDQAGGPKRKKVARRSNLPDTKGDDMYHRKLVKEKAATISDPQSALLSYLLNSPLNQQSDAKRPPVNRDQPDVTYDDLLYRNVQRANASPRTVDPQPPFGIPLGPVAAAPLSDYLHATPAEVLQTPKKIPDIVKDDLAFRNLRKEQKLDLNYLKKRRAVRSLSANIGSILAEDVESRLKSKTLTDIADAMEIARRVLQEKGKNIHNTRKAFMSDTELKPAPSADSLQESRMRFLSELRNPPSPTVLCRPPKGPTPERKPTEEPHSTNSSLDDLLNALAEEAKVTTERITKELQELEARRNNKLVNSSELIEYSKAPSEEALELQLQPLAAESANIVQSCFKDSSEERKSHDYEPIDSEQEEVGPKKCQSPFQERKAELVATFQELKDDIDGLKIPSFDPNRTDSIYDNVAEGRSQRRSRFNSKLPRWLRPFSCPDATTMADNFKENRNSRIARYKEERRKQLAADFGNLESPRIHGAGSSSSSEGPRPTRASRLRAQASQSSITPLGGFSPSPNLEPGVGRLNSTMLSHHEESPKRGGERDKSSKRKSNLNRSLTSEVVPPPTCSYDDAKTARRRRRFFPQEVLSQAPKSSTNHQSASSAMPSPVLSTASISPSSPLYTSNSAPLTLVPRRSELSVHMANARKSVTASDPHKYKPFAARRAQTSSPKDRNSSNAAKGRIATSTEAKSSDKEKSVGASMSGARTSMSDNETSRNIAKRMEELTAFTRETLARVERLANRTQELPKSLAKLEARPSNVHRTSAGPSSILKRNRREEKETAVVVKNEPPAASHAAPVSILKRTVARDEKTDPHSTHTPPVTFSPSVVDPATSKRKQGILKKRRSLDESTVMRHRSCSPDVANKASDFRSILKSQRRSSLEELRCLQSPEPHIQGILKRKPSRNEEDDVSLSSPHSILKRRSGASSAGSTGSTPHVSITTAVILAAAGGAEMILEPDVQDPVRPILKKKSSEECSFSESTWSDTPKPILKKKSSTDTDDGDDSKPIRPILKLPRGSREALDTGQEGWHSRFSSGEAAEDCPRPRLSFCGDRSEEPDSRRRSSRRPNTICSDFNVQSNAITRDKEDDRDLRKARTLSVLELVKTFEKQVGGAVSTGAVPKRPCPKRSSDRYRTQPVTSNELEESRNLLRQEEDSSSRPSQLVAYQLSSSSRSLDTGTQSFASLQDESRLSCFLTSPFHSTSLKPASPESPTCHKTSSDSAFQSLGDGLELEEPNEEAEELTLRSEMANHMKSLADEVLKKRLERDLAAGERRGILKPLSPEGAAAPRRSQSFALKGAKSPQPLRHESAFHQVKPSRADVATDKDDEGISCNGSGSDSEGSEAKPKPAKISVNVSTAGDDTTSEGESSGGREVKRIFRNENKLNLNFKQQLEGCLAKSKSSSILRPKACDYSGNSNSLEQSAGLEDPDTTPRKASSTLRRSHTHTAGAMPRSIAALRAELQENGEKGWMKRVPVNNNSGDELKSLKERNRYNDELSEKSLLAAKKDELDAAAKQWKNRVEKTDAEKFSVAGKMSEKIKDAVPSINIPAADKAKRTPHAKRYKGREDSSSTPASPEKNTHFDLTRSQSALAPIALYKTPEKSTPIKSRVVPILRPDDNTFTAFFESVEKSTTTTERLDINAEDLDAVERESLLSFKKNVQVRRRRGQSRNPIKALAVRTDIASEYTETITGVAEREKKRLNIEKLAENSNKAVEALAGLASNEDFKAVALKKGAATTLLQPWKQIMLLQIKGRRQVQTRLVEPVVSSINEGDCYLLITPTALYNYAGIFSNVIEQSRAADVANHIQKTGDMGCRVSKVIAVGSKDVARRQLKEFWKLLGAADVPETVNAGHPNEDESFESNILQTNMVYVVEDNELAPFSPYWGSIPKIEMLSETNVIVFDFGSEMYVWSGKNAPLDRKQIALKLAKEMWAEGYNYSDCTVNPLNVVEALGERQAKELPLKAESRPSWALFAKITQHRETVLFREKFLDWPDYSRVIRMRNSDPGLKRGNGSIVIKPCNVDEMVKAKGDDPDLVIQNTHLGRGERHFDEETRRLFEYDTQEIKAWRIMENTHEELGETSIGQLYDGDCYIYSWRFRQTVKGRELNGNPSKHALVGRDMCVFFCWHGSKSSINEKCTAAFLTVELDKQNAPQVRVVQGSEPAAFLRLFGGGMVIHHGKRGGEPVRERPRLFIARGELEGEAYLMEVPLEMASLRSRSSFVLVQAGAKHGLMVWHGCKASEQKRRVTVKIAEGLLKAIPLEIFAEDLALDACLTEMVEGEESAEFAGFLGADRTAYHSLLQREEEFDFTPRLFKMSSITGDFTASEILCPHRSQHSSPYPFVQYELYSASQPGLLLFDNHHELWLWQGWWPENDEDSELNTDQTGSGAIRWQAERRAAMQTAINYWRKIHGDDSEVVAHAVWAGLEPLEFTQLFPTWKVRPDVKELSLQDGKKENDKLSIQRELALLSRTTYPLAEILQRPLPKGVDPTQLEVYLCDSDFQELLEMSKEEFEKLPSWKKTSLKKEKGLF
ncbi:uncharacterized protein LOC109542202 isoform X2 [Dendroctonus ponderosae]|uniref:uncharacterized protein LOC109542202 isoform X2 n=1 Tax=Dendroctonus ponderosae TaxID=77166 RepID=UPI0020366001|nr:uncharacterized protein LOC109542202 isoform X2 [Dendroctonus ponderosae]